MGRIDHVVIAVEDLEKGSKLLRERTGLSSVQGGRHPGRGTENMIVPLDDGYLELITVVNFEEAQTDRLARCILETLEQGRNLVTWVVEPERGMDALCQHASIESKAGSRTRPDGVSVRWKGAGLGQAVSSPPLPFFIEWDDPALRPDRMLASHDKQDFRIKSVQVGGADSEARVQEWLGDEFSGVSMECDPEQPSRLLGVTIASSRGPFQITDATFKDEL